MQLYSDSSSESHWAALEDHTFTKGVKELKDDIF